MYEADGNPIYFNGMYLLQIEELMMRKILLVALITILSFSMTTPALAGKTQTQAAVPNQFTDVSSTHWAVAWINQLYTEGVTSGCGTNPLRYCPDAVVTRAEMAVFLVRVIHGSSFTPPVTAVVFDDVPAGYWASSSINCMQTV